MTSSGDNATPRAARSPSTSSINVNLIIGLDGFFPAGPVAFSDGNIMLGGGGSDFIEGRGGNDIIDGDACLHVELTRDANGNIFAGSQIVREILTDQAEGPTFGDGAIDFFSGLEGFGALSAGESTQPCWLMSRGLTPSSWLRMPMAIFSSDPTAIPY